MASQLLAPNPCLIGIALVIRKKTEPQLVYHYPPQPGEDNSHFKNLFKDDSLDTSSTSSEDGESTAEDEPAGAESKDVGNKDSPPDVDETGSASPQKESTVRPGDNRLKWNDVFGYKSSVLAKALCPARGSHKRFEMSLGDNVVLGRPVYAKEDGSWRKKREPRRRSSSVTNSLGGKASLAGEGIWAKAKMLDQVSEASAESSAVDIETDQDSSVNGPNGGPGPEEVQESKKSSNHEAADRDTTKNTISRVGHQGSKDSLVMFHLVFVLRPPPLEYHARVKDMYDHVVKKLTRALKWEQARSGHVAREASLISSATGRVLNANKESISLATLYHDLISQSSLAKAIAILYNGITSSRIAHLSLTPALSLSLQIPIPASISILPTPLTPQMPGLWLTTATFLPDDDDDAPSSSSHFGSHFTLLLLYDLHTILADVNAAASPITGALTHYLRVSKSTKSFSQISQASGIPLSDVQLLASHLIYWRRARAIPPLRQADTYIVSPNADMRELASASSRFAKAFPIMPPLPRILSMLSAAPKPYSTLIPNKDRKEVFMEILAWLLRGGWVTQLRTFAWVRVPPHIKAAVDGEEEEEHPKSDANGMKDGEVAVEESRLGVPELVATSPTSSTHTALPIIESAPKASAILIPNPRLASALPSRYLSAVSAYVEEAQGEDCKAAWGKCMKYFDGKHAIESIAVREVWKRKRVMELVNGWEELGVLSKARHW